MNLVIRTRLSAPINVGSAPNVDAMIWTGGKPRQMFSRTAVLVSLAISDHARTIGPLTMTASGDSP